ncbi:unnamed protein product, partial [Brenthis ino]
MPLPFCPKGMSLKSKFFTLIIVVIIFYMISSFTLFQHKISNKNAIRNIKQLKLDNVVVHLDLKGSPPKLSYLKTLLPKLRDLGVTGLLIEYEDMFPYDGKLLNLSARNCYKKPELQEFLSLAVRVGFDIIPLVQTFGHMEYALKLPEFQHLRELPGYPDSLCPSKHESRMFVEEMLEQIVKFHGKITPLKYLHIGCDEVFHINKCKHCLEKKLKNMDIYLSHVRGVTDYIKAISPETEILAWDDMFRGIPVSLWNTTHHPDIDLVYWDYTPGITTVSHVNLMKYHKTIKNIWIASAFKGADGRTATYPDLRNRFSNHFSWTNLILDYTFGGESEIYNFKGIILTGWSRYSHMDPPCELLPVAIPSLYLNLLLIKQFKKGVESNKRLDLNTFFVIYMKKDLAENLHCGETNDIDYFDTYHCYFDGNELNQLLKHWDTIETNILYTINKVESSLSTIDYYSKTKNINMNMLLDSLNWYKESMKEIMNMKKRMIKFFSRYYDDYFVEEYTNLKLHNTKKILDNIAKHLKNMLSVRNWDRRPYK